MFKLNFRLLLILIGLLVVVGVAGFLLHRWQQSRTYAAYLVQATRAEEEKKPERAGRLLRAYVLAVPTDVAAHLRYAQFLDAQARTPKAKSDAVFMFEKVLKLDPNRHAARRRAAELSVELGGKNINTALAHLEKLKAATPNDGRVYFLIGFCQEAKAQYVEAVASYDQATLTADKPAEAFVRRAGVQRLRLNQVDSVVNDKEVGPQAALNELVIARPGEFGSFIARAAYHKTFTKPDGFTRARTDLTEARRLAPDEPLPLLASAQTAVELASQTATGTDPAKADREKLWAEARGYLEHGLTKSPKVAALHLLLAEVERRADRRAEAIKVLLKGRDQVPPADLPEVLFALGGLYADAGDKAGTDDTVARLVKLKQDATRIDLIRGESLVRQGQWYEASGVLEKVRPLAALNVPRAVHIDLLLARCYAGLGDLDRQLVAYNRAKQADGADVRTRLGLAAVKAALGRIDEAIEEYEIVTQGERSPVTAWVALARLMVYRNLTRPPAARRWAEVDEKLKRVAEVAKESVELPVLEAEVLLAKGDAKKAEERLVSARNAKPSEPEFWFALATLADRGGDNKKAQAVLDEAQKALGDTADLRIARLRVTPYTSADQAEGVLNGLADGVDRFPADDRARLLRSLGSAYWLIDRPAAAAGMWDRVAALRPAELSARLLRYDAALRLDDDDAMQRVLADIRLIEGSGPLEKYGAATRLIWLAGRGDKSKLADARSLLGAAAARRPGWSRIPLALARIAELEGNTDLTLDHLKQAVELGDRQVAVVKRVAQLLDDRGRGKEADDILRRLESQAPISNDLQKLAAEVSVRLDVDRAVTLARKAVQADSKDYKEQVWLGRMLSAAGEADEAEGHFRDATAIAPDQPEVWVAAVGHAVRRKDADPKMTAVLLERADAALAGKQLLALAVCHELAGNKGEAEKRYLAAVRANPGDAKAVRATAAFYQQSGLPAKAEPFLRKLLEAEVKAPLDDVRWARRNLALAVGVRPDAKGYTEAATLLDANAAEGENPDDLRARALLAAQHDGKRAEVIALLEKAERLKPPTPDTEFLLATLYEAAGDWRKARERMLHLIGTQKDKPAYLRAFAAGLIRRGDFADADVWVTRLADAAPNAADAVALRAELLCRTGRADDALKAVRQYRDAKPQPAADPAARALFLGGRFDLVHAAGGGPEAAADAEAQYAEHRKQSKMPEAALPLAAFYGRHDEPAKALDLCEEALKAGCPLERVLLDAGMAATSGTNTEPAHFAVVEGWLAKPLAAKPESPGHRFLLGCLREQQGKYDAAEAEYAKVLAKSPAHTDALNNLAFLLAMRGKGADAVKTAEKAVAAVGDPSPNLRDTRGVALTAAGDLAAARKELETAAAVGGSATAHFHLAVVQAKQKEVAKAKATLRLARNAGLRVSELHPLERPTYLDLVKELKLDS